MTDELNNQLPPFKIAFVIDGEIVDILHTDERLASIFLSNPTIIDVSGMLKEQGGVVEVGATYNDETKEFTPVTPTYTEDNYLPNGKLKTPENVEEYYNSLEVK